MLLEARGLGLRRGRERVLDDVTFDVVEGSLVGVIGPNGAGKTSLLEAIAGFLPLDSGHVHFADARPPGPVPRNAARAAPGARRAVASAQRNGRV